MSIQKIVGKKSFARLKKAGYADPNKLKKLSPDDLMKLAGIGPKKAEKLYKAMGIKYKPNVLERAYSRLKLRTRLKNLKKSVRKTAEDPKPVIEKIESKRKEALAWQNFLATVYNFGKKQGDRVDPKTYIPVSTVLDPSSLDYQKVLRKYAMEAEIIVLDTQIKLSFKMYDMKNNRLDYDYSETFPGQLNSDETAQRIVEEIEAGHDRFREKSDDGYFILILQEGMENIFEAIQTRYAKEIENSIFRIADSKEDYYKYEVLIRFFENPIFEDYTQKVDAFKTFFDYFEIQDGNRPDWDTFKDSQRPGFIDLIESGTQKAHMTVSKFPRIEFGVIQSMPGLFNFKARRHGYMKQREQLEIKTVESIEEFENLKKELPLNFKGKSIRQEIIAFVTYVFGDSYSIWYSNPGKPLVISSDLIPEIGIVLR
jgi:hypothetical protein